MRRRQSEQGFSLHLVSYAVFLLHLISVCGLFALLPVSAEDSNFKEGETLAFETARGNCLACHEIPGGSQMGDIGPPLNNMVVRFPERARLFQQIWDAGAFNVKTLMPPYGRHEILTTEEINTIIDFLYTK